MAALIFGWPWRSQVTDGYILAVTETFMVLFTISAFYLLASLSGHDSSRPRWLFMLGIGGALGAALSLKQIAVTDVVGLMPMYWVAVGNDVSPRRVLGDVLLMALAGGAVTAIGILPLLLSGVTLYDYWNGAWHILLSQTGKLSAAQRMKLIAAAWLNPAVAAYYPFVLLYVFQKGRLQKAGVPFWSLLWWLCLAFVGANANEVFKHNLKQVLPPLALMAGLGVASFVESMAGFTARYLLWLYLSVVAALAPFNSVLVGIARQVLPAVVPCPGASEERTDRRLAEYIRAHTAPPTAFTSGPSTAIPSTCTRSVGRPADTSTRSSRMHGFPGDHSRGTCRAAAQADSRQRPRRRLSSTARLRRATAGQELRARVPHRRVSGVRTIAGE